MKLNFTKNPKLILGVISAFISALSFLNNFDWLITKLPWLEKVSSWVSHNGWAILLVSGGAVGFLAYCLFSQGSEIRELENQLKKKEHDESQTYIVFLLTPSGKGFFYSQHLSHLLVQAPIQGGKKQMITIPFVPHSAFGGKDPEHLEEELKNFPAKVDGVFLIPKNPDDEGNLAKIRNLKREFRSTILLDVFANPKLNDDDSLPCFIGGNELEGGRMAANIAKRIISSGNVDCYTVFILVGRKTEWEYQRVESFKQTLGTLAPGRVDIEESAPLNYQKADGEETVKNWITNKRLEKSTRDNDELKLDIVFACNDDMALGALAAIEEAQSKRGVKFRMPPKIIGYDGNQEIKILIEQKHGNIAGSIDVNIEAQAEQAVESMFRLLSGKEPENKFVLQKPKPITSL